MGHNKLHALNSNNMTNSTHKMGYNKVINGGWFVHAWKVVSIGSVKREKWLIKKTNTIISSQVKINLP